MKKVVKALMVVLCSSHIVLAHAEVTTPVEAPVVNMDSVNAALATKDVNIIGRVTAETVVKYPDNIPDVVAPVVTENPDSAVPIISAVQVVAPDLVAEVARTITRILSNTKNEKILALVLSMVMPAAGNNVPAIVREQQAGGGTTGGATLNSEPIKASDN